MTKQDVKAFADIMAGMADVYNKTLTAKGLRMRFDALREYSIQVISDAATRLLKEHRFNSMPTVGDFVKIIDEASGKINLEDKAEIEAGKVLSHLRQYGAASSPRFDDPITRQLMNGQWRYGSWARNVLEADLPWWRKEFIRAYKAQSAMVRIENPLLKDLAKVTVRSIPPGRMANHAEN